MLDYVNTKAVMKKEQLVGATEEVEFGTPNVTLMSSGCGDRSRKEIGGGLGLCLVRKGAELRYGNV